MLVSVPVDEGAGIFYLGRDPYIMELFTKLFFRKIDLKLYLWAGFYR
jgi:hypothetical protein